MLLASRFQIPNAKLIKGRLQNSVNNHVQTVKELQPGRAYTTDV